MKLHTYMTIDESGRWRVYQFGFRPIVSRVDSGRCDSAPEAAEHIAAYQRASGAQDWPDPDALLLDDADLYWSGVVTYQLPQP